MRTKCPQGAVPISGYKHYSDPYAHMHSHGVLTGAMRGGHTAPSLGGLASSVGASPRPQVSRSTSLPVPVAEGPAARLADLGAEGHGFFSRRFSPAMRREPPKSVSQTLQCSGTRAHVHDHGVPAARLVRNRFGLGVGMGAV